MQNNIPFNILLNARLYGLTFLCLMLLCHLLTGCSFEGNSPGQDNCQSNCVFGPGASGLTIFIEPDAGPEPLVSALREARKSIWMEMYLLTNKNVLTALEDKANEGLDVRVMLEQHPYGGSSLSPPETLAKLQATGIKAQFSNPAFALTHEKGLIVDGTTAYIMTSNMTNAALGTGKYTKNREYNIVDTNLQDVQAIMALFQADWEHTTASFRDPDLVVSPVNARAAFNTLIARAKHTLLVTAEEMQDNGIEQDLSEVARRGVTVQVILPAPGSSSNDSNFGGVALVKQYGVSVREDAHLYMHAKMLVADGQMAFVGSENISGQSLDLNRELGILIADRNVIQKLQQTFQEDWNASQIV